MSTTGHLDNAPSRAAVVDLVHQWRAAQRRQRTEAGPPVSPPALPARCSLPWSDSRSPEALTEAGRGDTPAPFEVPACRTEAGYFWRRRLSALHRDDRFVGSVPGRRITGHGAPEPSSFLRYAIPGRTGRVLLLGSPPL